MSPSPLDIAPRPTTDNEEITVTTLLGTTDQPASPDNPDGTPRIIYPAKTVLGDGTILVDRHVAEEWLKANSRNRKLSNPRVNQMARDMAKNDWDDNGETVKFSRTGVLLDGQHRLSAVIESDTVQVFTVIAGLDDKVQRSIDIGGKRTIGNNLDMAGHGDGKTLASVARFAMQMQVWPQQFRPTDMELTEIIENDKQLQWVVKNVTPTLPAILGSPTIRTYVYRVLHSIDPDACATFFSKLTTLDKLPSGSPILALYRRLATPDMRKDGMRGRVAMVTAYFIAWNAWRRDEERQLIKPHPDADGIVRPPKPV